MLKVVLKGFGILLLCFGIGVPSYADYYFGDRTPRDVKYKLRKLDEARRRMKKAGESAFSQGVRFRFSNETMECIERMV